MCVPSARPSTTTPPPTGSGASSPPRTITRNGIPSSAGSTARSPRIETHPADRTPRRQADDLHPKVTHVEPDRRLAWLGRLGIPRLFDGAHSFTLEPLEDRPTRLVQSESFTGILVWFSGRLLKKTEAGFHAMNDALKERLTTPVSSSEQ